MSGTLIDQTCKHILEYLIERNLEETTPIRYNILFKELNQNKIQLSRPTLSKHLQHLIEQKIIIRSEHSKTRITFHLSPQIMETIIEHTKIQRPIQRFFDNTRAQYDQYSLIEIITHINVLLNLQNLVMLKHELQKQIMPEESLRHELIIMMATAFWKHHLNWVLKESKERGHIYREEMVEAIDGLLERYLDYAFLTPEARRTPI